MLVQTIDGSNWFKPSTSAGWNQFKTRNGLKWKKTILTDHA
jgi:hypothetical protein